MRVDQRRVQPDGSEYPEGMKDLEHPPAIYVAGTMVAAPAVAVVGTRRCTRYGSELADAFGRALTGAGWSVVSGLARGIDAAAHRSTVDAGGHAVAVLGSGVDIWYPAENRHLYEKLLDSGGALVSEYPPGTRPDRWRFPARNRIIAAIASATVIVEAGEKGGALITARLAAEMGRPVFVVPGDVDRAASIGCNRLIRDGAHPVLGPSDLIEELSLTIGGPARKPAEPEVDLPPGGISVDDLPDYWGCSIGEALVRVGRLESEGLIRRVGEMLSPSGGPGG